MKHFYLVQYIIKGTQGNLHRFFKADNIPVSVSALRNSLKNYLFEKGVSIDQIEILSRHNLSEKDYNEYIGLLD